MTIGLNDDYAGLWGDNYSFYYGYDSLNNDGIVCFEAKYNDEVVCQIPENELKGDDAHEILLYGIGLMVQRGYFKINTRITNDKITELKDNEIFVFGSNEGGEHLGGAARLAYEQFGAKWGWGEGIAGQSYALPSVRMGLNGTLSPNEMKPYVDRFIAVAQMRPDLTFFVTEIGCGLAGLPHADVAPLFEEAVDLENVHLPAKFWEHLL